MDKDEIVIYTREVDHSPFHEILAETKMEGSIEKFRKIITDFDNYSRWLTDCKTAEIIENPSKDDFTYHMKLKVPFPFTKRDMIQQIVLDETEDKLVVEITNRPEKIKEEEDYVRMKKADGRWIVNKISEDHLIVKFQYLADPEGDVPAWMVNTFIVKYNGIPGDIDNFQVIRYFIRKCLHSEIPFNQYFFQI